jgi:hypothetical protein
MRCDAACNSINVSGDVCGDDHRDLANEVCDDGNTVTEPQCPYGSATCNVCNSTCTQLEASTGNVCGEGARDLVNEACDDGNTVTELSCPYGVASCTRCDSACLTVLNLSGNVCGDFSLDASNEACDDGNAITESQCPYGQATCSACNSACTQLVALAGDVCGDGSRDPNNEQCDDGNTATEVTCPYGNATCTVCTSACTLAPATGNVCGDGLRDTVNEACDDNNTSACGTCGGPIGNSCSVVQSAEATGLIVAIKAADIIDGETFSLDDGLSAAGGAGLVIFEFNKSGGVSGTNTAVNLSSSDSATTVRTKIRQSINGHVLLSITAADSTGSVVQLTHDRQTSLGNTASVNTVADSDFGNSDMTGGQGGDCVAGTECQINADCISNVCLATKTCQ